MLREAGGSEGTDILGFPLWPKFTLDCDVFEFLPYSSREGLVEDAVVMFSEPIGSCALHW